MIRCSHPDFPAPCGSGSSAQILSRSLFRVSLTIFLCSFLFSKSMKKRRTSFQFFFFLSRSLSCSLSLSLCALLRCLLLCFEAGWLHREERRQLLRREQRRHLLRRLVGISDPSRPQRQHHRLRDRSSLLLILLLRSANARSSPAWDRASTLRASRSSARSFW